MSEIQDGGSRISQALNAGYSSAMRRRDLTAGLGYAALARAASAQPRRYRVGMLDTVSRQTNPYFGALQKCWPSVSC